jgi:hypothetical protein
LRRRKIRIGAGDDDFQSTVRRSDARGSRRRRGSRASACFESTGAPALATRASQINCPENQDSCSDRQDSLGCRSSYPQDRALNERRDRTAARSMADGRPGTRAQPSHVHAWTLKRLRPCAHHRLLHDLRSVVTARFSYRRRSLLVRGHEPLRKMRWSSLCGHTTRAEVRRGVFLARFVHASPDPRRKEPSDR